MWTLNLPTFENLSLSLSQIIGELILVLWGQGPRYLLSLSISISCRVEDELLYPRPWEGPGFKLLTVYMLEATMDRPPKRLEIQAANIWQSCLLNAWRYCLFFSTLPICRFLGLGLFIKKTFGVICTVGACHGFHIQIWVWGKYKVGRL